MLGSAQAGDAALDQAAHIADFRAAFQSAGGTAGGIQAGNGRAALGERLGVFIDGDAAEGVGDAGAGRNGMKGRLHNGLGRVARGAARRLQLLQGVAGNGLVVGGDRGLQARGVDVQLACEIGQGVCLERASTGQGQVRVGGDDALAAASFPCLLYTSPSPRDS